MLLTMDNINAHYTKKPSKGKLQIKASSQF